MENLGLCPSFLPSFPLPLSVTRSFNYINKSLKPPSWKGSQILHLYLELERDLFSHNSGGQKTEIKVLEGPCSLQTVQEKESSFISSVSGGCNSILISNSGVVSATAPCFCGSYLCALLIHTGILPFSVSSLGWFTLFL